MRTIKSKNAFHDKPEADARAGFRPTTLLPAGAVALLLAVSGACAAGLPDAAARTQYEKERSACIAGKSHQDRTTCLQEAAAALRATREGGLNDAAATARARNSLVRCDALPDEDRTACIRRMRGDGIAAGSAAEGGIYRELSVTIRPKPSNPESR